MLNSPPRKPQALSRTRLYISVTLLLLTFFIVAHRWFTPGAWAESQTLVISQIYGGGGNTGAPYQNDYVELFNRGATTVSVSGWSVQYASANGSGHFGQNVITLSGSLAPGQYYLVKAASGGASGSPLPAADAMNTAVNLSGTAGKVILANTTTGLACNGGSTPCTAADSAAIVDLVGYGAANFFEGTGPAPAPSNTTADFRAGNGCTDTDNNAADFLALAPAPRNSVTTPLACGVAAPTPTATPTPTPTPAQNLTPIYQIQGGGATSPLVGTRVTTSGVITGIKQGSSGGFFIQDPSGDENADTSDGVFVFTGANVPAGVVIGNGVQITGTVQEFVPAAAPSQRPLTELSGALTIAVLSTGNSLPAPVNISDEDTLVGSLDNLEKFEGMRVRIGSLTVIAPTSGTINEASATVTSNGVFYGVVTGVPRPLREPGINLSDPLPLGAPPNIPRFDGNPEKIRVDSDAQPGTAASNVAAGVALSNIVGELDYSFRAYTLLPEVTLAAPSPPSFSPVPTPREDELAVASFNMERFFDTADDPRINEPVLTPAAFNNRVNKASLIVREVQRMPDVIGVEEVENLQTLQAVAAKINADALAATGANPNYQAYLVEGNDVGGIDVGFLVKSSRITVFGVTQIEKPGCDHTTAATCNSYINPNDGTPDILNDRPPLVLRAAIARPEGGAMMFTVIVNHLRSLSGIDDPVDGRRIRAKRRAQAEFLAGYIQSRQAADAAEKIISLGDYNAFQFNDGYVDVLGTILGTPASPDEVVLASADLVNPDLTDLCDTLPPEERYSFVFDGDAQALDHILVNRAALEVTNRFAYARDDADFPLVYYADGARPERLSDHDQPVAYFSLAQPRPAGSLVISEFRFRGPLGPQDEFVELYNDNDSAVIVSTTDGSAGWALVGSDGEIRFIISNGTTIPARGHFLGVNANGYSLAAYPAGVGTTAAGDLSYTADIPDAGGIALFNTADPQRFTSGTRLDAAGFAPAAPLYREGAGVAGYPEANGEYSHVRRLGSGAPQDTGDNAADFLFVAKEGGAVFGAGSGLSALGAPGPENSSSPVEHNVDVRALLVDASVPASSPPNRERDTACVETHTCPVNAAQGFLIIRRRFLNNTGRPLTRLRFRLVEITTQGSANISGGARQADLRVLDAPVLSPQTFTSHDSAVCGSPEVAPSGCTVTALQASLEQPPVQPGGGGFNSTLTVNISTPIPAGANIYVQFTLGVQQWGKLQFFANVETLFDSSQATPIGVKKSPAPKGASRPFGSR